MICSALVYILLTCSSDLTAPLPWIHYTSAKEFTILQKQLLLHTNRQGVKTLCTVSLLLKAFSGRPLLPIVALQCFCRPPPVRHGCKPSLSTPIGCILWLVFTCYSVLSINRRLQRLQELKKGFFLYHSFVPRSPNSQRLHFPHCLCQTFTHGRRGGYWLYFTSPPVTSEWKGSMQIREICLHLTVEASKTDNGEIFHQQSLYSYSEV